MNNKIEIFNNSEFGNVRTYYDGEKLLFCGSDVARALGYAIPSKAVNTHCKGVSKMEAPSPGGSQTMLFITEGDVYRLIVRSKLPAAERFEHWLFDEVVPMIRKTGCYMTESLLDRIQKEPAVIIELAQTLLKETNRANALEAELGIARPKADYFDAFVNPDDCTNIRTTAKELGVPEKQFTRYLEEKKYLFRDRNRKLFPRAVKKSAGLFLVRDFYTERGKLGHYTLITPAGKRHFLERTDEILFE